MSGRNDELLSAYFDGELTGDEKSVVEQLLADDSAARDMLDDVAEVSGWVRSLPRPAAAADLHAAVLSRVRAAAAPVHVAATAPRPQRRRQLRWIAAATAGVLAAVVLSRTWPVPDPGQDAAALGARSSGTERAEELASTERFHDGLTRTASVAEDPTTVAIANSGQILDELAKSLESGATPVPGEMVQDVAQFGDQVLFIQYRVVDTQDLPGQVQVILSQNGFATVGQGPAAGRTVADFDAHQNGQFEAIYLDSPVTNFNSAIAQITDLDQVTSVMTNNVSFTEPATEGTPEADGVPGRQLELAESRTAESEAPPPPPQREGRLAVEQHEAVRESVSADDSAIQPAVPESAPLAALAPLGVVKDEVSGASEFSRPADQRQGGENSQDAYEVAPGDKEIVAGQKVEPMQRDFAAFQCAVPVPDSLLFTLRENEELLTEGNTNERLSELTMRQQLPQQRRQFWNFPAPPVQGPPPAPDRIRAVLLLVPQKSE